MKQLGTADQMHQSDLNEDVYWLALQDKTSLVPVSKMMDIYKECGTLSALWNASYSLVNKFGIGDDATRKFIRYKEHFRLQDFVTELKNLLSMHLRIIRYADKEYPDLLKSIENPPLLLLHKGTLLNFENCIAISGTRNPSAYGRATARKIAKSLAEQGFTIVSGLARGIDEWAHCGALEASGGRSIAVLAWMDPIYPDEHLELAKDLQKRGALLAENSRQPLNRSAPARFVQRNRIISGISDCVIAVESDEEGGTVHQVRIALSQKRKVYALQPEGNERAKKGFKVFVDMGAIPIKSVKDMLNSLKQDMLPTPSGAKLDSFYQRSSDREGFEKDHL